MMYFRVIPTQKSMKIQMRHKYYKVKEAAKLLGVTNKIVYERMAKGHFKKIKKCRCGKTQFIRDPTLDILVETRKIHKKIP